VNTGDSEQRAVHTVGGAKKYYIIYVYTTPDQDYLNVEGPGPRTSDT